MTLVQNLAHCVFLVDLWGGVAVLLLRVSYLSCGSTKCKAWPAPMLGRAFASRANDACGTCRMCGATLVCRCQAWPSSIVEDESKCTMWGVKYVA
jgi:hypothetical protein